MNTPVHQLDIRADAGAVGRFPAWLGVRAEADPTKPAELLIVGQIGKNYWDDSGVDEAQFRAALASIPAKQPLVVGINSQGGSVQAGLGIYNALRARGNVTTRNDGIAASIASLVLCAGDHVVSPRTAAVMIHDPWAVVAGNSDEMEKAKRMLEANAGVMVAGYSRKSGQTPEAVREAMKAETWQTGEESKAFGFVDELNDDPADFETLAAAFDPDKHPKAPANVRAIWASASGRRPANQQHKEDIMNRTAILALLKKHGVNIAADATDESVLGELNKLVEARKIEASQRDELTKPTPAPVPAPVVNAAADPATINRIAALEAENARMRRESVERQVDTAVAEYRVPAAQRDAWVRRSVADATILDDLRALPQRLPGAEPVAELDGATASITDIAQHYGRLTTEVSASFLRGNNISPSEIQRSSVQAGQFYSANRARFMQVLALNTLDSALKRNVVLQEVIRAFAIKLRPLSAFSTVYSNVPLEGTDIISVPYFALHGTASTDWNAANGYVMADSAQSAKSITVNKRKYQPIRFDSSEMARWPALNIGQIAVMKAEKLAVDVFSDVLSVVTLLNYGAAAFTGAANTFDTADIADLKAVADKAYWPTTGRGLLIKSDYDVNVLKDTAIKASYAFGSSEPITAGTIPRVFGFDYLVTESIPANGENLVGMITVPSAILVATSPIMPNSEVRQQLSAYQVVTDPSLGVSFEYRRWGNADMDQRREVIECNYGYAVGEVAALERMVSA